RLSAQRPRRDRGRGLLDAGAAARAGVDAARLGGIVGRPAAGPFHHRQPARTAGLPAARSVGGVLQGEAEDQNLTPRRAVMPRESGASSNHRTGDPSDTRATSTFRWLLDRPLSRAMTGRDWAMPGRN